MKCVCVFARGRKGEEVREEGRGMREKEVDRKRETEREANWKQLQQYNYTIAQKNRIAYTNINGFVVFCVLNRWKNYISLFDLL